MVLDAAFRILKYLDGPGYDDAGEVPPELHEDWDEQEVNQTPDDEEAENMRAAVDAIGLLNPEQLESLSRRMSRSGHTKASFGSGKFQDSLRGPVASNKVGVGFKSDKGPSQ